MSILDHLKDNTYNYFMRIDPEKAMYAYADGKWTIKQVLGHMADTERVFAFRALCFSRESVSLPSFDQDVYMQKAAFNSRSLDDIAGEYKTVREATVYLFNSMTEGQWLQKGTASGSPVSVRALAYMIVGHEMHHLKILKERYF